MRRGGSRKIINEGRALQEWCEHYRVPAEEAKACFLDRFMPGGMDPLLELVPTPEQRVLCGRRGTSTRRT